MSMLGPDDSQGKYKAVSARSRTRLAYICLLCGLLLGFVAGQWVYLRAHGLWRSRGAPQQLFGQARSGGVAQRSLQQAASAGLQALLQEVIVCELLWRSAGRHLSMRA